MKRKFLKILAVSSLLLAGVGMTAFSFINEDNSIIQRAQAEKSVEHVYEHAFTDGKTATVSSNTAGDPSIKFNVSTNKKGVNFTFASILPSKNGASSTQTKGCKLNSSGTVTFTTTMPFSLKFVFGNPASDAAKNSNVAVVDAKGKEYNSDPCAGGGSVTSVYEVGVQEHLPAGETTIKRGDLGTESTLLEVVVTQYELLPATFNPNGGSFKSELGALEGNNYLVKPSDTVTTITAPTAADLNAPEGKYVFKGWFTASTGGTQCESFEWGETYYAQWDAYITITVNGESKNVSLVNGIAQYTFVALDNEGSKEFIGWSKTKDSTVAEINCGVAVTVNDGDAFYPVYLDVGTVTVTFKDGDMVLSSITDHTKGTPIEAPVSNPTKEGYRFAGWVDASGNPFDFTKELSEKETVINATWDKQVNVSFVDIDGSVLVNDPKPYYVTDKVSKPADPTKENYVFDGWYNGNELYDFNSELKGDITLTAHWKNYVYTQIAVNGVKTTTVMAPVNDELSFYKTVEQEANGGKNVSKVTTENGVWNLTTDSNTDPFVVNGTLSGEAYNPTGSVVNKVLKCEMSADEYIYTPNTKVNTIKAGATLDFYLTNRKDTGTSSASFKIEFMTNGVATEASTLNETYTLSNTSNFHVNKCTTVIANDITFDSVKITHTSGKVCLQAITFGYDREEVGFDLSASKYSLRFTEEVEALDLEGKESVTLSSYYKIDDGAFTKVDTSTINVSSLKVLENGRYELSLLIYNLPVEVLNHSITVYFEVDGVKSAERTVTIKELAQKYKDDHSSQLTEFELNLLDELLK